MTDKEEKAVKDSVISAMQHTAAQTFTGKPDPARFEKSIVEAIVAGIAAYDRIRNP